MYLALLVVSILAPPVVYLLYLIHSVQQSVVLLSCVHPLLSPLEFMNIFNTLVLSVNDMTL